MANALLNAPDIAQHDLSSLKTIHIGGAAPTESYLDLDRVMKAAKDSGAEAIHPGYGFLSERKAFPEACAAAGIAFIGPPASAMDKLGDKLGARELARQHGVPVTPGTEAIGDAKAALEAARTIGLPVIIKPSGGGGGIGMKVVEREEDLRPALESAANAARCSSIVRGLSEYSASACIRLYTSSRISR